MARNISSKLNFATRLIQFFLWLTLFGIIVVSLGQILFTPSTEGARNKALNEIQKERNSKVITLIHRKETISVLGIPVRSYIDLEDAEKLLRIIRQTPKDKPIDLIMHTPGGLVLAASQIAQALEKRDAEVTVLIPHYAMSGGTLIALAADKIIMDPNAVLGPIDPQVGFFPAASILKAKEMKSVDKLDDYTLIVSDVAQKAVKQMTDLAFSLLKKRYPEEKARTMAEKLATGQYTHDYPITVERAHEFGLTISTNMPQSVYNLMDFYSQQGEGRPSVRHVPLTSPSSGYWRPPRELTSPQTDL